ncbi:MAG: threonine synthase [Candidatus Cloacimonadales bacterium]
MTEKYFFECSTCGETYSQQEVTYTCPKCEAASKTDEPPQGVLKTLYDYKKIKAKYKKEKLFDKLKQKEFVDLLPISSPKFLSMLKVGKTPLYQANKIDGKHLSYRLYLKDDSQNPTYSFKDRASNLVSAYAKENNIETIVAASTGNAGSSLAGICAAQDQKAIIFAPQAAPKAKLTQICMYGAQLVLVDGTYDDAFDLSMAATKKFGWYNRNTAYNPFTIEGKKIVSYELFQQLQKSAPDKVFVSVGDGCIISGVFKGFEDLLQLGLISKMPTIIAVQSEKSDNIIRNLTNDKFESRPSNTVADSIAVDLPRNYWMTKNFIEQYQGEACRVSDAEILAASQKLSSNFGIFSEPAAAAAFAGLWQYQQQDKLASGEKVIVLLTGSGLKDLASVQQLITMPQPIKSLDDLQR